MSNFDEYYVHRWEAARLTEELRPSKKKRLSLLVDYINKINSKSAIKSVLDYGCGSSWLFQHLESFQFPEYHIYDVTPTVVKIAKEKFPTVIAWAGDGSFPSKIPSNHIDLVASIEVIEHVPFSLKRDFLMDVRRVLRPGGHYFLTTPNARLKNVSLPEGEGQPVEDWLSMNEVKELLSKTGFVIEDYGSWYFDRKFSCFHKILLSQRILRLLQKFGIKNRYQSALGRLGLGLSLYFLCRASKEGDV